MAEFDPELCKVKHGDLDRRLAVVETTIKENLVRIYDKLDRPSWLVTAVIAVLMSSCSGMAIFLLTRGH